MQSPLSHQRTRRSSRYHRIVNAIEALEGRVVLTWPGAPPASILIPAAAVTVVLNNQNNASGSAAITASEIDYYRFTAPSAGIYAISTETPNSKLDTVLGVFTSNGSLLAGNNDGASTDSQVLVTLKAGAAYYVGITNNTGSLNGTYSWLINGPDDDKYEQNDTLSTAKSLGTLDGKARNVTGLQLRDDDWFRFAISQASTSALDFVAVKFQNAQGNINLQLFNSQAQLVGSSTGVGDTETISLQGLPAGAYFVRVFGATGSVQNPNYSLTIDPPDDDYEQNDTLGTAKDLGTLFGDISIANLQLRDDDWYQFTPVNDGVSGYTFTVKFDHPTEPVRLTAYDGNTKFIATADSTTGEVAIQIPPDTDGPIYLRVSGILGLTDSKYQMNGSRDFPDDDKEENDDPDHASDMGTLTAPVSLDGMALNDADYFRFKINSTGGAVDKVRINFSHASGDLALRLYKRTWNADTSTFIYTLKGTSQTANNFEELSLSGKTSGIYVVYVYGQGGVKNPNYSLTVDPP